MKKIISIAAIALVVGLLFLGVKEIKRSEIGRYQLITGYLLQAEVGLNSLQTVFLLDTVTGNVRFLVDKRWINTEEKKPYKRTTLDTLDTK